MRTTTTLIALTTLVACAPEHDATPTGEPLTEEAARIAVDGALDVIDDDIMVHTVVDLSGSTTIGERLEDSLDSISDFWESQADCVDVSLDSGYILLDFGSLDDECSFNGRTYAGLDWLDIDIDSDHVEMYHDFEAFTDGNRVLDGHVDVRNSNDSFRRDLRTDYTVAFLNSSRILDVQSNHSIDRLDPTQSISDYGYLLDGERSRTMNGETWTVELIDLEMKVDKTAPSGGAISTTDPDGKVMEVQFVEQDNGNIRAMVTNGGETSIWFFIQPSGEVVFDETVIN